MEIKPNVIRMSEIIEDTQDLLIMVESVIEYNKIDEKTYLVLREWNKATPYVIHYWSELSGYFWGQYLSTDNLKDAKRQYFKKLANTI